jgi:hypothetical protein
MCQPPFALPRTVTRRRCRVVTLALLGSRIALAQPREPSAEVEVAGQRYGIYAEQNRAFAVPLPLNADLVRDPAVAAPSCAVVDSALYNFSNTLENCKADPNESACTVFNDLVATLRADTGMIGQNSLRQRWNVVPAPIPSSNGVAAAAAARLGVAAETVQVAGAVEPAGAPESAQIVIDPAGTSWASRLLELPGGSDAVLSFDGTSGQWITEDQIVACGLVVGDVRFSWVQPANIATGVSSAPTPFSAIEWSKIYANVAAASASSGLSAQDRALNIGRALGDNLRRLEVSDTELEGRAEAVLGAFFSESSLSEIKDLQDVETTSMTLEPAATLPLGWVGRIATEGSP